MVLSQDRILEKGIEAHRAGKVREADRLYTSILRQNPQHPDANHNIGVLAVEVGKIEQALPFFKTALKNKPDTAQYWMSYIDTLIKLNRVIDAKIALEQARGFGAVGNGFDLLTQRIEEIEKSFKPVKTPKEPRLTQLKMLSELYARGQYQETLTCAQKLLQKFPNSTKLYNLIGTANLNLGELDDAIDAYNKALAIKPDNSISYSNLGLALQTQGRLNDAIESYKKALSIDLNNAGACNNLGTAYQMLGKIDEAIKIFQTATKLKPDFAEAFFNFGNSLRQRGKIKKAVEAYRQAVTINPDYAEAYCNLANALEDMNKQDEARQAYKKSISIRPDYPDAHRHLSNITRYSDEDPHIGFVRDLYGKHDISVDLKCQLSFVLFKMYEDVGQYALAFEYLCKGNELRKTQLNYSIDQDQELFRKLKRAQQSFAKFPLGQSQISNSPMPVFIIGMPRSGTTLVEQIISSHSNVVGGGELNYVGMYGHKMAIVPSPKGADEILDFREKYLTRLKDLSKGKPIVTDKLPQNFLYIPLILAALPEAKIIHVNRNPAATCWSNFKHYFASKSLGYSYNLEDVVAYYHLYNDLLNFWNVEYPNRIYDLNYDKLVVNQDKETRNLVKYLKLNWEDACLSPHENRRSVITASQHQVRQVVYQGSSEAWKKYQSFLGGAFDSLPLNHPKPSS